MISDSPEIVRMNFCYKEQKYGGEICMSLEGGPAFMSLPQGGDVLHIYEIQMFSTRSPNDRKLPVHYIILFTV